MSQSQKRFATTIAPEQTVAAIDIGTNSIHMVVAKLSAAGTMTILDTDKVTLKLGQELGNNNTLSDEAIGRVVDTIKNMKNICATYKCRISAVATHATRTAVNHEKLLDAIRDA